MLGLKTLTPLDFLGGHLRQARRQSLIQVSTTTTTATIILLCFTTITQQLLERPKTGQWSRHEAALFFARAEARSKFFD